MLSSVNITRNDGNLLNTPISSVGISGLLVYTTNASSSGNAYHKLYQDTDALDYVNIDSVEYYHIKEYFKYTNYPLYLGLAFATPNSSYAFGEVEEIQLFAEGEISVLGVLNLRSNYNSAHLSSLQTKADSIEADEMPLQIVYSASIGTTKVESLLDISNSECGRVSFIIGEDRDSGGDVVALYTAGKTFVGSIGTTLGNISKANPQENIGWTSKFNVAGSISVAGFIDGSIIRTKTKSFLDTIDSYGYIFFRKFNNNNGVYFNYSTTLVSEASSDFSTIERNRVYDIAYKSLKSSYLPFLNANVLVTKSGNLNPISVTSLENVGKSALSNMKNLGYISDFSVTIDPNQKINVTKTINVVAKILPVGVSKWINVALSFNLSL